MSLVPPLPPRRKVPSVPSRGNNKEQSSERITNEVEQPVKQLGGIAARIAALKLDQVGRTPSSEGSQAPSRDIPQSEHPNESAPVQDLDNVIYPTLSKRPPPPVPVRTVSDTSSKAEVPSRPALPPRRLPSGNSVVQQLPTAVADLKANKPPPLPTRRAIPPSPQNGPKQVDSMPETDTKQNNKESSREEQDADAESASEPKQEPMRRRLPPAPPPSRHRDPPPQRTKALVTPVDNPVEVKQVARPPVPHRTKPAFEHRASTQVDTISDAPQHQQHQTSQEPHQQEQRDQESETCLKCRDFDVVDQHASQFPREQVSSIAQLAYDLTSPFESVTDKARAIFTWMHHNIAYDAHSFLTNNLKHSTPEDTIRTGMAVCAGYSGLYASIAEHAGLHVLVINGHGKGYGYTATKSSVAPPFAMNHAWNAVAFDDNEWHLIDSTWGAGYLDASGVYNKRFTPSFFTMTNDEFGLRHFPEEIQYQLRSDGRSMSWEEYILAPETPTEFGEFRKMGYDTNTMLPSEKVLQRNQWVTFHLEKVCWHLERKDWWSEYVLFVTTGGDERVVLDRDERGPGHGWTAQVYIPGDCKEVMIYSIATVNGKEAKGMQPDAAKKSFGRCAMSFSGVAMWKVE